MNEHCETCPLEFNPVTYRGAIDAPIVVLCAAPSLEEVENGMSVGGASGSYMLDALQREGFDLNDILFVNSIMCRASDPDLITLKTLQACQSNVDVVIAAHPRKLIVAMGNTAWSSIHNLRKIGGVRVGCGKVIHCSKFDCWSVWNIDPLFALRSPNWKPEFEQAIRRAYQTYTIGAPQRPPATILECPATITQALEYIQCAGAAEAVSYDIETGNPKGTPPNYQVHPILGIGFGWSDPVTFKKTAFYLPILHGFVTKDPSYFEVAIQPVWTFDEWLQIDVAIREHIFNGNKKLIAQNGKFDARFLRYQYNYNCPIWFDTIIAHRLIDENKSHSLKSMARFWLNAPDWDVFDTLKTNQHLGYLSLDEVAEYCAYDAVYTLELSELYLDMLEGQSYEKTFWELDQPLFNELINVELEGVKVDPVAMEIMEQALLEEIQCALQECAELSGWAGKVLPYKDKRNKNGSLKAGIEAGVNPNSPKDIQFILYDHFKLPIPTDKYEKKKYLDKKGNGKTDKITIDYHLFKRGMIFNEDGEEEEVYVVPLDHPVRDFVKVYQHYRSLKTIYGNVIKGVRKNMYPDGKIHTNYGFSMRDDNNSPTTGRLSSNSPNMQNIKAAFKPMFIPPYDGWKIIEADMSQSEIRVWAYHSQDQNLIHSLVSGDFHTSTAAMMMGKDIADVTKEDRQVSKVISFGAILFGGKENVLMRTLHCSRDEASKLLERAYSVYPDGKKWIDTVIAECNSTGYVTTIFGRCRRLPEIWSANDSERASAERQAVNSPIQGASSEITNLNIVKIAKYLRENNYQARIINTVHDSIVVSCPEEEVEEVKNIMLTIMTTPPFEEFNIPLEADVAIYDAWGGALDINKIKNIKEELAEENEEEEEESL